MKRDYDCEKCLKSYFDEFDRLRCLCQGDCDGGFYEDEEEFDDERNC